MRGIWVSFFEASDEICDDFIIRSKISPLSKWSTIALHATYPFLLERFYLCDDPAFLGCSQSAIFVLWLSRGKILLASKHAHCFLLHALILTIYRFCAHEYEKSKDMAAAALAYKLVEVAYMRVIYSSHGNASRDRNELQAALQIIPTGTK